MQNLEKEVWKTVEGHPYYYVSNLGRVFSVKSNRIFEGRMEKSYNYKRKIVYVDGKEHILPRIVAKAFPEICGEWFDSCEVHHKDFNPLNNRADNLKVCTVKEHHAYHRADRVERMKKRTGEKAYWFGKKHSEETRKKISQSKIEKNNLGKTVYQFTLDGQFIREWKSTMAVKRELGFTSSSISECCKGKLKTSHGFKWEYKKTGLNK